MARCPRALSSVPLTEGGFAEGIPDGFGPCPHARDGSPMTVRGGGVPGMSVAFMPDNRMGPPLRSFAADAHHCIMVRVSDPPNRRMWHECSCTTRGLPLDFVIPTTAKCAAVLEAVKDEPSVGADAPILDRFSARTGSTYPCGSGRGNGLPDRTRKLTMRKDSPPGAGP